MNPPKAARGVWFATTLGVAVVVVVAIEWLSPRHLASFVPRTPLALNVLAFAALAWLGIALTNRALFSAALATLLFATLAVCNQMKLRFLGTPVHPADLLSVSNLLFVHLFSRRALAAGAIIGAAVLVGVAALSLDRRFRASLFGRLAVGVFSLAFLGCIAMANRLEPVADFLSARGVLFYAASPANEAEVNGLLLDFLLHVSDLFVPVPAGYDLAAVQRSLAALSPQPGEEVPPGPDKPVSLVIFVVEAMMDPADLGLRFTADPMPFFRDLRRRFSSGWAYSPEAGGRSANPEFEMLSGLATYFLPRESVAYVSFITRPLPALPRFFLERGYHATALHVDTLAFFNYVKVYANLGFSDARTLRSEPNVPLDASGRVPSDEALVDAVIETSRQPRSYFLFAFTNGTHLPYDYPAYLDSDLDIVDPMPKPAHDEVKTYVNALRAADRAIEKLVRFFETSSDRVVIAILGDHLPGLSQQAFSRSKMLQVSTFLDGMVFSHRCPVVLWSNTGVEKRDFELSFNFLAQRILAEMRIPAAGVWRANGAMASQYPVLSKFVQRTDGQRFLPQELPQADAERIREFGLIQYDLLFGAQYSLREPSPAATRR